jgi:NADPH:quinone reductase-like Zn-dependent oxidoreductase
LVLSLFCLLITNLQALKKRKNMKAAVYTRYGGPEVVRIMEVEKPIPKNNEILIKVEASTVNRTDCGFRSAEYFISRFFSGLINPKIKTLGNEFAGIVEEIGNDVSEFSPGDKVFGYNDSRFGAHAEYMLMDEKEAVVNMPANCSFKEAAPICEGGHYALCNIRAAKVKKGDKVLLNGATGAIGSAALQLLKHFEAEVTAVCETKNIAIVQSLGADEVIDYLKQDFTDTTKQYDFVFDAVGKSSFAKCKKILTNKGIYISTELGKHSANVFLAMLTPILGGKKVLFPIPFIKKEDVIFLKSLVEKGEFKPLIDREYSFDEIVEAYTYVETGQKIGNVLLSWNPKN